MRMQLPCINIYRWCFLRGQNALRASETGYGTDDVFVQIIECSVIVNKFSFSVPALARIWLRAG